MMVERNQAFEKRVVLITGASGGLGKVVSRHFAELGASLILVGTSLEKLDRLGNELGIAGDKWFAIAADLTNGTVAQDILKTSINKFGHVDILLNLVGGWAGGKTVPEVDPGELSMMLDQLVWSTFHLVQALVPHMVENKFGRIIIISSPNAAAPPAKGSAYAIGKAGQETLMLALAAELKGTGVTANVLRVRTIDVNHERDNNPSPKSSEWTTPEEITATIAYLCSTEANSINGARIPLYGSP
jgi:NAD(P)-dependent dehydrogenase (short-subunit alcohol dehydrogenase family)